MNVESIREIAKGLSIRPGKLNKADLIRNIQTTEGNFPCFGTAYEGSCDQWGCLWREDCLAGAARSKVEGRRWKEE